jgi:leucyl/phenylalanyl-tRNA--protein transferase
LPTNGPVDETGLVAIGADLEPGTLLAAYRGGLFPMPYRRRQVAWFSPDPRGIIPLDGFHISRSLRRSIRRFEVSIDTAFRDVMKACADPARPGAWINQAFIDAYCQLFDLGWGHSVEVWRNGELVGGVYGVRIDRFFAGEAMFHRATDASKVALAHLVEYLVADEVELFDVQWTTPHLASLGAIDISRADYLRRLAQVTESAAGEGRL